MRFLVVPHRVPPIGLVVDADTLVVMGPDHYAAGAEATLHPGPEMHGLAVDTELVERLRFMLDGLAIDARLDPAVVEADHGIARIARALAMTPAPKPLLAPILVQPMDHVKVKRLAAALSSTMKRHGRRVAVLATADDHAVPGTATATPPSRAYHEILAAAMNGCNPAAAMEAAASLAPGLDCTTCLAALACTAYFACRGTPRITCTDTESPPGYRLATCTIEC